MGPPWTFVVLLLLFLGPSHQDPQLAMVAPGRVALGVPVGVLLQATEPVAGMLVARAQGAAEEVESCSAEVPFALTPHNDFSQLLHLKVSPEQAARCGLVAKEGGRALLLEARSPQLPPTGSQHLRVTWGGPRGHLFVQTDKPIYAPRQTVRFRVFSLDPELRPSSDPVAITILDGRGVPVRQSQRVPVNAMISDHLILPDVARPGTWQVQAQLVDSPNTRGATSFAVRKYVLPTFGVKIVPERNFILVTDPDPPDLRVELHIEYLHGAPVGAGVAQLRVGLGDPPGPFLRGLEQRCPVTSGRAVLTLSPRAVARALGRELAALAGARLRLAAAVLETRGGELVQQESTAVKFVASPWRLDLSETPRVFVPGTPFLLLVQVTGADGMPAPGVPVRVQAWVRRAGQLAGGPADPEPPPGQGAEAPRTDPAGALVFPVNMPADAVALNLTVEAGAAGAPPARAALAAAAAVGPRTLALAAPGGPLRPGELLRLQLRRAGEPPRGEESPAHVLVVSGGRLVQAQRVPPGAVTEVALPLLPALAPAFRVVAFYRAGGRLVAAGLRLRLAQPCRGQVEVRLAERGAALRPQTPLGLTVAVAGPGPVPVALGAIDAAVLALDARHRLSQEKVAAALGALDQGCGPGGAPDAWGVFKAAGLALAVGGAQAPPGPPPTCPPHPARRRRRSLGLQKLLEEEGVAGRCCRDGAAALPLRRSCAERGRRVPRAGGCRAAFERCCDRARRWRRRQRPAARAGLGRALEAALDEELLLEDELPTRSFFPESWLWRSLSINGSARLSVLLPDSITTWEIHAIAIVPGHGVCVAAPLRLPVSQELHVGLRLPPGARPREQLQPRALLHSRLRHGVNVTVGLSVAAGVCAALAGGPQHLEVPPGAVVAVPFTLVALGPGDVPITITARGPWGLGDRITRVLHIEAEGEPHLEETSYVLDTDGRSGRSLEIPGDIPADVVPDGHFSMSVRVAGQVSGATLEAALGAGAAGALLRVPRGCGEQTMMVLAPAAAALRYLDESEGWGRLAAGRRERGLRALQQGYERIQSFRKDDGSYGAWLHRPSSTWLSALVLRVLVGLRQWQQVDEAGLRATTRWLLRQQGPPGAFRDPQPIIHRRMQGRAMRVLQGGVAGAEAAVSLTAFVAVALHRARDVHGPEHAEQRQLLDAALARAGDFLRGRVEAAGPFAAAIGTYALALSDPPGPPGPLLRLARSAQNGSAQFWPAGGAAETVETTGYGLLALLRLNDVAGALRVARWLREQSNYGGGFHSTQDTVVALEALSELWLHSLHPEELGLDVTFTWPPGPGGHGAAGETRVTLRKGLEHVEKELEVPLGSPVTVQVEGEGQGTLTVLRQYRVMSPTNGTCRELGLEVTLSGPIDYEEEDDYEEEYEDVELTKEGAEPVEEGAEPAEGAEPVEGGEPEEGAAPLTAGWGVEARRRRRRRALGSSELRSREVAFHVCIWRQPGTLLSGMAVVDISLLSGFRPHREDLDKLQDVVDRYISHYELDGSRLVLYFDEVPAQRDCVTFGATQEVAVGLLQPAAATIFDYYEPEHRCTVFYSAPQRSSFLATLCSPGVCECAEGACPRARRTLAKELTAAERLDFACYSPRVDYALVVVVQGQGQFGAFAGAETKIEEVLQSGAEGAAVGQRRWFFVRAGCGLRLRPLRRYLLMGRSSPTRDPHGRPQAVLGPNSWVEEVPSPSRCGATRLRGLCAELQSFLSDFAQHGCQV